MSSVSRRFLVNGASVFGGEVVARIATALMALVVARSYGSEALGHYGYALALASVLLIVPDFGLHLYTTRELAASPGRLTEIFWGVHWVKFGLAACVAGVALWLGQRNIADYQRSVLLYVLVVRILLQTFSQAAMAVFKALECMHYIAIQQTLNSFVVVGWVAASLALDAGLSVMVAGLAAGQLAETSLGWIILRRIRPPLRFRLWDRSAMARIIEASFPIGLTAILVALNVRIDIFVVSRYTSADALGQFNAAMWFLIAAFLVASLMMSVLFSKLSRILDGPPEDAGNYLLTLVKNALCMTALAALLTWLSAPVAVPLLFGSDFAPAAGTLRILVPALPLIFLNTILFFVFAAARRRFVCLGTLAFALGTGILLSVLLTSAYGVAGSAIAAVIREFAISSVYLFFLVQGNYARIAGFALMKVFVGATALLILSIVLAPPSMEPVWLAAWMALVLGGTLVVLGLPRAGEWRLLMDDRL